MAGLVCSYLVVALISVFPLSSSLFQICSAGVSTLLVMALPALLYSLLLLRKRDAYSVAGFLGLSRVHPKKPIRLLRLLLFLLLMSVGVLLLVQAMGLLTEKLLSYLPSSWQEFAQSSKEKEALRMQLLFSQQGIGYSLMRILALAVIPAFSEELFMRGALQPILINLSGNPHVGIIVTAVVFSLLHLSVLNFLGILVYALFFGYMAYTLRSINPGIILHFLNNFATLVFYSMALMA